MILLWNHWMISGKNKSVFEKQMQYMAIRDRHYIFGEIHAQAKFYLG